MIHVTMMIHGPRLSVLITTVLEAIGGLTNKFSLEYGDEMESRHLSTRQSQVIFHSGGCVMQAWWLQTQCKVVFPQDGWGTLVSVSLQVDMSEQSSDGCKSMARGDPLSVQQYPANLHAQAPFIGKIKLTSVRMSQRITKEWR